MIIHSYIITFPDETDTLPDALNSMSGFSDHIYLVDGGLGEKKLCWRPRFTMPIREWLPARSWNGVPLTVWENELITPGGQRNWILNRMAQEPEQPDWIFWIDSDEVCSEEFIRDIRPYLEGLPPDISNICPKWFTLIQDEQHYTPSHSNFLAHARIHHPGVVNWGETWHENQFYVGRRVNWDNSYIIHTRLLFRSRLFIQRAHIVVNEGGWVNVTVEPVPAGITWKLHWPEGEPVGMPYNADIRHYEGGRYAK